MREQVHRNGNDVVPFVGSGLSSTSLPSWRDLLASLIDDAQPDLRPELGEELKKEKYFELASHLESLPGGAEAIASRIKMSYQNPRVAPPDTYKLVADLPVKHFATTNYDPWLKNAVSARFAGKLMPRVFIPQDPGAFEDIQAGSAPLVLMLHGDADRPDRCVLSTESYQRLMCARAYRSGMSALCATRTFLFIGHSVSDPDLVTLLAKWREDHGDAGHITPRHYFLGAGIGPLRRGDLLRLGVMPIEYGRAGDHSLLGDVLRHLATPP